MDVRVAGIRYSPMLRPIKRPLWGRMTTRTKRWDFGAYWFGVLALIWVKRNNTD